VQTNVPHRSLEHKTRLIRDTPDAASNPASRRGLLPALPG
jgi:hypothetical protein